MKHIILAAVLLFAAAGCCYFTKSDTNSRLQQLEQRLDRLEKRVDELDRVKMLPVE